MKRVQVDELLSTLLIVPLLLSPFISSALEGIGPGPPPSIKTLILAIFYLGLNSPFWPSGQHPIVPSQVKQPPLNPQSTDSVVLCRTSLYCVKL